MSGNGFANKEHPLLRLTQRKNSARLNELERFLLKQWEIFSAKAWKSYKELGRGAVCITLSDQLWSGSKQRMLVEYIDLVACHSEEIMTGPFTAMGSMGRLVKAVSTYEPTFEIVMMCRWQGWDGFAVSTLKSTATRPEDNYWRNLSHLQQASVGQVRYPRLPNTDAIKVADDCSDPNQSLHWLVNQQWEIFASAAWKGYLEQGRGVLSVLLGQESDPTMGLKRDAISLEMPMEYFEERPDVKVLDPVALMSTGISDPIGLYELVKNYQPERQIVLEFQWIHSPQGVVRFIKEIPDSPPSQCYKALQARSIEFK